ncbi:MAG: hypothetical protein LBI65_01170, partial [Candidatus Symbiothrix sp.]|nr:hypothetical protein [Candidatus Symbiothrix sp.]
MTILQQPDSYSLTSMIKELIISAENDILFEILSPEESLLIETYTPDAENRIHIRDLGVFFEKYLS